ncbi:MAG: hypothetical protein ACOVQ4_07245 [Flectobacillus sp.]|uniref:hypothetical protein n=1 Tax=Flectobacillus sp. TaxID=50419 RepID=UPI003B9B5BF9
MKALTVGNIFKIKHRSFVFLEPWSLAFGKAPSCTGVWLIYGKSKNGKTSFALMLAKFLATLVKKLLYISAEEGLDKEFVKAIKRAGITPNDKNLNFTEYLTLEALKAMLRKRGSPEVIMIDNIDFYRSELNNTTFKELTVEFPSKLFIFLAHEERNEPYPSLAKACQRAAKSIVRIKGLKAIVSGRLGDGGTYTIDEEKAKLYWGENPDIDHEQ